MATLSTTRAIVVGAVLALLFAAPRAARANGRYPLANQLVVDPGDPGHLVVRTTFGILESHDSGATFGWICETLIGSLGSTEDPAIAVTAGGTTLAASSVGLSTSANGGCSWRAAPGLADGRFGIDVAVVPSHPHEAFAIASARIGGEYNLYVVKTGDDGASFQDVGSPLQRVIGETIEIAPSRSERVYLSGRLIDSSMSAIERSDDGGQTWTEFAMAGVGATDLVFIGAVDPRDPDVLYVRIRSLDGTYGRVLVSHDAGATFTEIWSTAGDVAGFALSADGTLLAVGGPESGLYVAHTSDFVFQQQSTIHPSCLTFRGAELFACANESRDRFSIGVSADQGVQFTKLLHLPAITPRACDSVASVQMCAAQWAMVGPVIADIGAGSEGAIDAGAVDAGAIEGAADGASPEAGHDALSSASASGGCGCRLAKRPVDHSLAVLAAALIALRAARKSRRVKP